MKLPHSQEGGNQVSYITRTLATHPGLGSLPVFHSPEKGVKIIWTVGYDPSFGHGTVYRPTQWEGNSWAF